MKRKGKDHYEILIVGGGTAGITSLRSSAEN
jgi:hypothetical protein